MNLQTYDTHKNEYIYSILNTINIQQEKEGTIRKDLKQLTYRNLENEDNVKNVLKDNDFTFDTFKNLFQFRLEMLGGKPKRIIRIKKY